MATGRRMAGVLAGLVLGGTALGIGAAHADDIVFGCPSGYTLDGTTCRGANGSTVSPLGMLPGDVDPETGEVLLPVPSTPDPTTTDPTTPDPTTPPVTTTTTAPPVSTPPVTTTTTAPPVSTPPVSTPPTPVSTALPPTVRPCARPGTIPAVGNADVQRTAAAVAEARARLAADIGRRASPAVVRADAQALATAVRDHAAALAGQRLPAPCPTR